MNHGCSFSSSFPFRIACLTAALWAGLVSSSARAEAKAGHASATFAVQTSKDIIYRELCDGEDPKQDKNKLDLYLPRGSKDFPVLFFVHGGAWKQGDKSFLGMYHTLGQFWARHGIGTVIINYRLSPAVKHPAHIQDVAKAFAWTVRNIGQYGGRPDQIFVSGHSAGGHLTALLATDESYLKAEGLTPRAIKGVISISGVYRIPAGHSLFPVVFGNDPTVAQQASPVCHVGSCRHPPFLIAYGDKDYPTFDEMAKEFCKALGECKCDVESLCVGDRNHFSVLVYATQDGDPLAEAMLKFIRTHTQK